jgi:hypothetical protein
MRLRILMKNSPLGVLFFLFAFITMAGCPRRETRTPPSGTPTPTPGQATPTPRTSLPDLTISDIRIEPEPPVIQGYTALVRGRDYSFRVQVTNKGPGQWSGGVAVSGNYGCQGPGWGASLSVGCGGGRLNAGESRFCESFTVNIPVSKAPGTCRFTFVVDPDNVIEEEDEKNNVWETTVSVY